LAVDALFLLPLTPPTTPTTLSLHDALPISPRPAKSFRSPAPSPPAPWRTAPSPTPGLVSRKNCPSNRSAPGGSSEYGRRNTSPRSEEHTSELSHVSISYAVFCLNKKIFSVQ